ncbi:MAG: hypothetical protein AAFO94_00815 [Bacteroidota bacterium]
MIRQQHNQNTYYQKQCSIYLLVAFSFFGACQNDTESAQQQAVVSSTSLPNTVEAVAEKWLMDYNNNRFAEAKKLSTPVTVQMIDTISTLLATLESDTPIAFRIANLRCDQKGDSARCDYLFVEPDFEMPDSILLVRQQEQWLVNMPYIEGDDISDEEKLRLFNQDE